jgi:hypothetical protein
VLLWGVMGCVSDPPPSRGELAVEEVRAGPACEDPGARATDGPWERVELGDDWTFAPDWHTPGWDLRRGGRGVIVADFDGDGHLDLVVPQVLERTRLLVGDGRGGFVDASDRLPALPELTGPTGGAAADVDGDGDPDLFLYSQDTASAVVLQNDGAGRFTGAAHPEWDGEFAGCGGSASFGDFDLDGDLDLYWGRLGMTRGDEAFFCGSRLLRNDGDGAWVDVSDQIPADANQMRVLASGFLPFDADDPPELYLVADAIMEKVGGFQGSDLVLDRGGGAYQAWSGTGLEVVTAGMGLAAGDPNGDGVVDVMVPGVDELKVLMSLGDGARAWADASGTTGIAPGPGQHSGWGTEWEDVDEDGVLDLVVNYGAFDDATSQEPDEIYRGDGEGRYTAMGAAWGVADRLPSRGLVVADLNEDGWPDLVKRELGGVVVLYLSRCGDAHWLQVSLDQGGPNPDAVGATVRIRVGDREQLRYLTAGSTSYQSSGPPRVQFGLGDDAAVDEIEVVWPDGEVGRTGPIDADAWVRVDRN